MKHYLLFAVLCLFTGISTAFSQKVNTQDYVEIVYFHGKQRCITCRAIEKYAKEVVEQDFAKELKQDKVRFKVIDISTPEGETIADKYEVSWSAIFINKISNGKETKNNMTDFGFSYAKNSPQTFKKGIKEKIEELLK